MLPDKIHMQKKVSQVTKAGFFSIQVHRGQIRKPSGQKYITHPIMVAKILRDYGNNYVSILKRSIKGRYLLRNKKRIFQAALLHDTKESNPESFKELSRRFDKKTVSIVQELSNDKVVMNQVSTAVYLTNKINNMSSEALLIKLVDRLCYVLEMKSAKKAKPEWLNPAVEETRHIIKGIKKRVSQETQLHKALYSLIKKEVSNL